MGLGLAFFVLYSLMAQDRLYGDASRLVNGFSWPFGERPWEFIHPLYPILSHALFKLPFISTPAQAMTWLSIGSGGLGLTLVFLSLERFGSPRQEALLLTSLAGASPLMMFFATTIEVHAPFLATTLGLLLLVPVDLSHKTGVLLAPAFTAVLWLNLRTRGRWNLPRAIACGLAVALAFCVAIEFSAWLGGSDIWTEIQHTNRGVLRVQQVMGLHGYGEMWLQPFALLWLLPLWIITSFGWRHPRSGLVLLGVLPAMLFFSAWGIVERGAYGVGILVFLLLAAALRGRPSDAPKGPPRVLWGVLLLQLGLGIASVHQYDDGTWGPRLEKRVHAVHAALPSGGVSLTIDPDQQTISKRLPGVVELNMATPLTLAILAHIDPQEFAQAALAAIAPFGPLGAKRLILEEQPSSQRLPAGWPIYVQALRDALDATYPYQSAAPLPAWTLAAR